VHEVLKDLRKVADQYSAVLIGETWTKDIAELRKYYGERSDELQMPMDFLFAEVNELSTEKFRTQIQAVDSAGGWPVFGLMRPEQSCPCIGANTRARFDHAGGTLPDTARNADPVLR
jgi:hypothetical protein